eukprot:scaffold26366_cov117-Cylindrotheca_fusiformis.AAC.10
MAEQVELVPIIVAIAAIAIVIHLTQTVTVLTTLVSKLALKWRVKQRSSDPPDGSVTGVFVHPVKSCRAVSLPQAKLDEKGFYGDRRFMVVYPAPRWPDDTRHRFLTQRQCPSLATIVAKIDETCLILECGDKSIEIPLQLEGTDQKRKTYEAGIWDDQVTVEDMGDEAAKFLQAIVDADQNCKSGDEGDEAPPTSMFKNIRLAAHNAQDRLTPSEFVPNSAKTWLGATPPVSLTDGFPILIACESSLDELNKKLKDNGKETIPMSRFRPNIVIQGTKPFEEDLWKYIAIGDEIFAIVKACPRCKQSCTDQQTGKVSTEPVSVMKSFRALGENPEDVFFAQNAIPLGRGSIKVGDSVRVIERGEPVYR